MKIKLLIAGIITVIICFTGGRTSAQSLLNSRQWSYYTYIYKITDREARSIYKNNLAVADRSYFHTLVDSFPSDSEYQRPLPAGYYLRLNLAGNKQRVAMTNVKSFEVFILNNTSDLCVQVIDFEGKPLPDAEVKAGGKTLKYDDRKKVFTDKKSNRQGVLEVTVNGKTQYYLLNREFDRSAIKRAYYKVLYHSPVSYIWVPVRYFAFLPIDGVRSVVTGYPRGSIRQTIQVFNFITYKVGQQLYRWIHPEMSWSRNHIAGYLVVDKPQYRPGDTVRLKSHLMHRHGRPVDKDLSVFLNLGRSEIKLNAVRKVRPGVYVSEFILHDSLRLSLDNTYLVELRDTKNRVYASNNFKYLDYELKRNILTVNCEQDEQYRGHQVKLNIKATDDNGLNLQDARAEILVKASKIHQYNAPIVFFPDTLIYMQPEINPQGETEIVLSDSAFPAANFTYEIMVSVRTTDNELSTNTIKIRYHFSKAHPEILLHNDSLWIRYSEEGLSVATHATVTGTDAFGHEQMVYEGEIPCSLPVNVRMNKYTVRVGTTSSELDISNEPCGLLCYGIRQNDSLELNVYNPAHVEFSWDLFCRNKRIESGSGKELHLKMKDKSKQDYFINLNYLWAGEVRSERQRLTLSEKLLQVDMKQPAVVYPGQKTTISVDVRDYRGRPVEGAELTAWAVTKKFGYTPASLSYYGKARKPKNEINEFNLMLNRNHFNLVDTADYQFWRAKAGIDTLPYYQFIYPADSIFRFSYSVEDSTTQFAPFVFEKGENKPVHVIYADNKPVFFSWNTPLSPYSFPIDSGYHQIRLRTTSHEIVIDSLYFIAGEKLIFSLDESMNSHQVQVKEMPKDLSSSEKQILYRYIMPYSHQSKPDAAYLQSNKQLFLLQGSGYSKNELLTGPVSGFSEMTVPGKFTHEFIHEAFYVYTFSEKVIRMRTANMGIYPVHLWFFEHDYAIEDMALTEKAILEMWAADRESKQFQNLRYMQTPIIQGRAGSLVVSPKSQNSYPEIPVCYVLQFMSDSEITSVFPCSSFRLNELNTGYYSLKVLFPGRQYMMIDSVFVKPDGINYYQLDNSQLKNDSAEYESIIELLRIRASGDVSAISLTSQQNSNSKSNGAGVLRGMVNDAETGEPVPFCNVYIETEKQTFIGAISDFDGAYLITNIPEGNWLVHFSSVGFNQTVYENVRIGKNSIVFLDAEIKQSTPCLSTCMIIENYSIMESREIMCMSTYVTGSSAFPMSMSGLSYYCTDLPGVHLNVGGVFSTDGQLNTIRADHAEVYLDGARVRGSQTIPQESLLVIDGLVYSGNRGALDQLQVARIDILSSEEAMEKYGEEGRKGVVEIRTIQGNPAGKADQGTLIDATFLNEAEKAGSLRKSFSDVGFWQPDLVTDSKGHAEFEVVFPDDVTCWKSFCYAMTKDMQSGQTFDSIKSYKPLMAQLFVPLFLIEGDSSAVLGKILNYGPDSVDVTRFFKIAQQKYDKGPVILNRVVTDTMTIVATDSLNISYQMLRDDGYFDGEERTVPVFEQGLNRVSGNFYALNLDTTQQISIGELQTATTLYATANELDILNMEIRKVIDYRYECNEQMASKLKALLSEKKIAEMKGESFRRTREIDKLIEKLSLNMNGNGLWGWWNQSETNLWVSLYVLEALVEANQAGHTIPDLNTSTGILIRYLEELDDFGTKLRVLNLLAVLQISYNYSQWLTELNSDSLSLRDRLEMASLQQKLHLRIDMDSLMLYQRKTIFGNTYFSDNSSETVDNSDLLNTLRMYKILHADTADHSAMLLGMRNYFFEMRKADAWQNTFESAQIIATLLPDMLITEASGQKPSLQISGDTVLTVTQFPFSMSLDPGMFIHVTKTGGSPVYLTTFQRFHEKNPERKEGDFTINTYFEGDSAGYLVSGRKTVLCAQVEVKKDADYIMITVPVPGGCSYASKEKNVRFETHREFYRQETAIFCEHLPAGTYVFKIAILPRFTGSYTLNAASVGLMYFPTFNANNEVKKVRVR